MIKSVPVPVPNPHWRMVSPEQLYVCGQCILIGILISPRPQWSSGFSSEASIFTSYWKWRVSQYPTPVLCAGSVPLSNVPIALGPLHIAEPVSHMCTGTLLSTAHFSGQQHITLKYPFNHWALHCTLAILVLRVQAQSRYAHMHISNML